jgi:GNAT superfamily N-acetyltransferase
VPPLALIEVPPGAAREIWVPILELADEPRVLRRYLHDGVLLGIADAAGDPLGAVLVIERKPGVAELKAVAVADSFQGHGLGTRLVEAVVAEIARHGEHLFVVGTASSGVRQLAFYQRCGFRLTHVERDFFTEDTGYPSSLVENGIPVRDMVWLEREV